MTSGNGVPVTEWPELAAVLKHRKSLINGNHLHHVVGGRGDAVALIHGFPQTWYVAQGHAAARAAVHRGRGGHAWLW